ncbi:nucleotidyltransferase family protein [Alteromonas lipolytica]|uniref:MobA-like NTP transferase domain-containing protein n=1 Tax=Alteromonas lipolytica TaxID=1856405 RepID=A0A1E8FIM1_9ALTE|nr:nucleotidyltransferase family protein [Alteromonas lipolytica]OFI35313.1 hypothetical protein BFC17_17430 [Alteromonas lipolytica]GGF58511.1 hypothetical protein GCM10011338_08480 [Alteromonas lipolytica]
MSNQPSFDINVAVLAAGRASRYGGNKLLATPPGHSSPLVCQVINTCKQAGLTNITLYTGYWHEALEQALPASVSQHFVENWQQGIAASLNTAAARAEAAGQPLLIALGDHADLNCSHLHKLVANFHQRQVITATQCAGIITPPVIFPVHELPLLAALKGDSGAGKILKTMVKSAPERIQLVAVEKLTDIDCPADWHKLD